MLVFPRDETFDVVPHFWLPEDGLSDKSKSERVPYDLWADEGYLTTIPGTVINPEVVARTVAEISETYDVKLLAFDRWRINDFTRELD